MVRLFSLNIPRAVAAVMDQAIKQERIGHKQSAQVWLTLATEIEAGKYLSRSQVNRLISQYPFLQECRL